MAAETKHKIRVAVFIPVFGLPSEIWSVRQCLGFKNIEPIVICWHVNPGTPSDKYGLECHELSVPWKQRRSILQRIGLKLGLQGAVLPNVDEQIAIRNLIDHLNLDAILCHFSWTGIRVGTAVGGGLPKIWHVHGRDVSASFESAAYRAAFRKLLPTADKVVAVGSFQLDIMKQLGLRSDQGALIPCGAPLKQFSSHALPIRRQNNKLRVISVGRLSPEKGILETIEAIALVVKIIPDTELMLIGDGELRTHAEHLVEAHNLQNKVTFLGTLPPQRVANELSKAHIFTQHSQSHKGWIEGFGVTLSEAGAAGLPLVASRFGGIVDQVIDGKNGILFQPGDIKAQAQAIIELAHNENYRYTMGATARHFASKFDSDLQIQKLEHVLVSVCGKVELC